MHSHSKSLTVLTLLLANLYVATGCNSDTSSFGRVGEIASLDAESPEIVPGVDYAASPVNLTAAWANDGGDKVVRSELRATKNPGSVANSLWDGKKIHVFGAKNEVVNFNLVLEAGKGAPASSVKVGFDTLNGPAGSRITAKPTSGDGVFDYTQRDIELFLVKYLEIKGLSKLGYEQYDERHIPKKLQRSYDANGKGSGAWTDRPNHNQEYPDIAMPMEASPTFTVDASHNQSVWADIYIPKNAVSGTYQGVVSVYEGSHLSYNIPVELHVQRFTLPDVPNAKSMLNLGDSDIAKRYVGEKFPSDGAKIAQLQQIRDRHFQMAHRHKISLIDGNTGTDGGDHPAPQWVPRLTGALFTAASGYRGPGEGTGNGVFSIGTYGSWGWKDQGASGMASHANAWKAWFNQNSPNTETFLYLIDESSNYSQIQTWASWLKSSGTGLMSMATMPLTSAVGNTPSLDIPTSTMDLGDTARWTSAYLTQKARGRFYMYNGKRPASGSFMTDDDGVALREMPWGQYKKGIDRWFYWESTYYTDYQSGRSDVDVWSEAQTFGANATYDNSSGMTSGNYANGDGVLFYPGTDRVFPAHSLGLNGPVASLRLKHWRRGIQDVDYLAYAMAKDTARATAVMNGMVRKVLWENGVTDPNDPTWVRCDLGWSVNPEDWENARKQLVAIIEGS